MRGATKGAFCGPGVHYISIHAPREGSDVRHVARLLRSSTISIHAPREGSDGRNPVQRQHQKISIHAPREGSDWMPWLKSIVAQIFLSTLPVRGATDGIRCSVSIKRFLSTLPVRGATSHPHVVGFQLGGFLSTLPVRGATFWLIFRSLYSSISIHAPREGSDFMRLKYSWMVVDFYPRSP